MDGFDKFEIDGSDDDNGKIISKKYVCRLKVKV